MKKLLLSLLLFFGCNAAPKAHPEIFIKLGQADQICAKDKVSTPVDIFVTLYDMPENTPVDVSINGTFLVTLYGRNTHVHLQKAGLGGHTIMVEAGGLKAEKSFTVYSCE